MNGDPKKRIGTVKGHIHCPRLDRPLPVEEHLACPYCYGAESDVAQGARECFCDFEKGKDPVSFGFPEDHGRYSR